MKLKLSGQQKSIIVLFIVGFLFLVASTSFAQEELPNPLGTTSIPDLIGRVIKALLGVTGSVALLMFIYGGLLWLTAAGDDKRIEKGKAVLLWATIGLAIIFTSYVLVSFVIGALTGAGQSSVGGTAQTTGCCYLPPDGSDPASCAPTTPANEDVCIASDGTYLPVACDEYEGCP